MKVLSSAKAKTTKGAELAFEIRGGKLTFTDPDGKTFGVDLLTRTHKNSYTVKFTKDDGSNGQVVITENRETIAQLFNTVQKDRELLVFESQKESYDFLLKSAPDAKLGQEFHFFNDAGDEINCCYRYK